MAKNAKGQKTNVGGKRKVVKQHVGGTSTGGGKADTQYMSAPAGGGSPGYGKMLMAARANEKKGKNKKKAGKGKLNELPQIHENPPKING